MVSQDPPREIASHTPSPVMSTPLRKQTAEVKGHFNLEDDIIMSEPLHAIEVKGGCESEITHITPHCR